MLLKCSNCGTPYALNDVKCAKCGHVLLDPVQGTFAVHIDPSVRRLHQIHQQGSDLQPKKTVALVVRGMVERFTVEEGVEITLGRKEFLTADPRHLDLTRYGGQDKGVSRNHARLRFSGAEITITDLGSSNGTFVNMQRLEPNTPQALHTEDSLMLC